ncbi:hypothetical protein VMCG_06617 [Cytospora schulzeri]|uniref:Uncharacterized protein n=1 Tax=Cytospora schulzeri TaxID=448051 RepID=A0A423W6S6_9PEZI|nr:hypothetical protein VMCG_06617 [Valsa malicola]
MEDHDMNMSDANADPSAPTTGAEDASNNQEIIQITPDETVTIHQVSPEAIHAATDNPALQKLLGSFQHNLKTNFRVSQGAMSSHRLVEDSSSRYKVSARGDQLGAVSAAYRKKDVMGIIENAKQIMKEARKTVDDSKADTKHTRQRLVKLEDSYAELAKENVEMKAMLERLIGEKMGGQQQVNKIRSQLADVSLDED